MTGNSNSVNIDTEQRAYHHGNLREALIAAGLKALSKSDSDELSMREVARNVGVSATSVYRHFPDKKAFVQALCVEGNKMLAKAQRKAMKKFGGGQKGFDATGFAYVRFALDNPSLFRLMSSAGPSDPNLGDDDSPSMQELMANVATLMPKDATEREKKIRAMHAWSVVHGVTMLVLDGRMPDDDEMIMDVIRTP